MKLKLLLVSLLLVSAYHSVAEVWFTNRTATISTPSGYVYKDATLVRGDAEGVIWTKGTCGGRIPYTLMNPELLESLGIHQDTIRNSTSVTLLREQQNSQWWAQSRIRWAAGDAAALVQHNAFMEYYIRTKLPPATCEIRSFYAPRGNSNDSGGSGRTEHVSGYMRDNGTYVSDYWRRPGN